MSRRRKQVDGPSLEAIAGLATGFFLFYIVAEGTVSGNRHPIHWVLAFAGAGAGYWIGEIVFRFKQRRDYRGRPVRRFGGRRRFNDDRDRTRRRP